MNADGKKFEVIVCSMDSDENTMMNGKFGPEYPWLCIPFVAFEKDDIRKKYSPTNEAKMTVIKANGDVIESGADEQIGNGMAALEGWISAASD